MKNRYPGEYGSIEIYRGIEDKIKGIERLKVVEELTKLSISGCLNRNFVRRILQEKHIGLGQQPPEEAYVYRISPEGIDYLANLLKSEKPSAKPKSEFITNKIEKVSKEPEISGEASVAEFYERVDNELKLRVDNIYSRADDIEKRIDQHEKEIDSSYRKMIEIFGIFVAIFSMVVISVNSVISISPGMSGENVLILMIATLIPVGVVLAIFILALNLIINKKSTK